MTQALPPALAARLSRLESEAKARGFEPRAARPPMPARQTADKTKPAPTIPAITGVWAKHINRPCPNSWERIAAVAKSEERKPYHEQDRAKYYDLQHIADRWAAVELRLVARMVCAALGKDWRPEPSEHRHYWHMRHKPTGALLSFRHDWQNKERYRICAENTLDRNALPEVITVSAKRTPASIAADIERRLIVPGAIDQHNKLMQYRKASRGEKTSRKLQIIEVAKMLSVGFDKSPRTSDSWMTHARCWPECASYSDDDMTSVRAENTYGGAGDRLELRIYTEDMGLIKKIVGLLWDHETEQERKG